jgi:hypothetical protein
MGKRGPRGYSGAKVVKDATLSLGTPHPYIHTETSEADRKKEQGQKMESGG